MSTANTTVNQMISEVRVKLRENTTDSTTSDRLIWSIIDKHLRWLIARESARMKLMRQDSIFQTIKCMEVIDAPAVDDCCGIRSRCTVRRTAEKLPAIYEDEAGVIIKSVLSPDGSRDFSYIKVEEYMRKLENPDAKYDKTNYFYFNAGYLYFPGSRIKKIMVKAFFEDEIQEGCYTCDSQREKPCPKPKAQQVIFIPDKVKGELMEFVIKDFLVLKQIPQDQQIDKNETRKS